MRKPNTKYVCPRNKYPGKIKDKPSHSGSFRKSTCNYKSIIHLNFLKLCQENHLLQATTLSYANLWGVTFKPSELIKQIKSESEKTLTSFLKIQLWKLALSPSVQCRLLRFTIGRSLVYRMPPQVKFFAGGVRYSITKCQISA